MTDALGGWIDKLQHKFLFLFKINSCTHFEVDHGIGNNRMFLHRY